MPDLNYKTFQFLFLFFIQIFTIYRSTLKLTTTKKIGKLIKIKIKSKLKTFYSFAHCHYIILLSDAKIILEEKHLKMSKAKGFFLR